MADYKIQLGIKLNTSDLKSQVDNLNGKHKIKLGVDLKVNDIRDRIRAYNGNSNSAKIKLGVQLDTKSLNQQIQALNTTGKNKKLLSIDTSSLNSSLDKVEKNINDIKTAMGTLDSSSGMKSLLASINQISTALDRAETQFKELNTSLNSLANKNFSINLGFNMSKSAAAQQGAYGNLARNTIIPQLKQQVDSITKYYNSAYKTSVSEIQALTNMVSGTKLATPTFFNDLFDRKNGLATRMFDSTNMKQQIAAYREYINLFRQAASLKGFDLTSVTSGFSQTADQLATKAERARTGVDQLENSFQALKGVLGSGIDAERLATQLDSIVANLKEIKASLQGLTQNASLEGLTQSFNNLSASIEKLIGNATQARNVLNSGLGTSATNTGTQKAIQEQNQLAQTTTQTANAVVESSQRVQQAFTQMTSTGQLDALNLQDEISEADRFAAALNRLKNIQRNIGKVEIGNINTSNGVQQLRTLEVQLESLSAEYNETVAEINSMGGVNATQLQTFQNQADTTALKLEQLRAKYADLRAQLERNIKGNFANYDAQIIKLESRIGSLSTKTPELQYALERVKQSLATLKSADSTDALVSANDKYLLALKQVELQLKRNEAAEKSENSAIQLKQEKQRLALQMSNWLRDNSAAAKQFGGEIQNLQMQLKRCGNMTGVRQIGRDFRNVALQAKEAGATALSFSERLRKQFEQYSAYFSIHSLFMYGTMALRSMFNQVKEIDSAMTELKKVTDETAESYNRFLTNAATRSKEIGTTISGLVESTADFARLGYSFKESQGLAEVANIYAVVGDEVEGVQGATESLISTLAAFKDEMNGMDYTDFAMSIIDSMNEIGNNFAISSGGLGEALKRSASSLATANNTIHESAALITAANTVVQNPEKVGNAFKTKFLNCLYVQKCA